jgi:hypothetical protein
MQMLNLALQEHQHLTGRKQLNTLFGAIEADRIPLSSFERPHCTESLLWTSRGSSKSQWGTVACFGGRLRCSNTGLAIKC